MNHKVGKIVQLSLILITFLSQTVQESSQTKYKSNEIVKIHYVSLVFVKLESFQIVTAETLYC